MITQRNTRERGFTLIELVVVIVIIGILAAFAIPRFAGLAEDARVASVRGMLGTVRSTSALVHGLALARNQNGAIGAVDLEGAAAVATAFGYPKGDSTGIVAAMGNLENYAITYPTGTSARFAVSGAVDATKCQVTFAEATASGTVPTITFDDTDC